MSKSTDKRHAFLGMPFGTAAAKLRKMVLFDLLKRHHENICVRCGKQIELIEELSLEHLKPWEDRDVALFWDINNIGFSHTRCNRPHQRSSRFIPDGQGWCSTCQTLQSSENFHQNASTKTGLSFECINCKTERNGNRDRSKNFAG